MSKEKQSEAPVVRRIESGRFNVTPVYCEKCHVLVARGERETYEGKDYHPHCKAALVKEEQRSKSDEKVLELKRFAS